MWWGGGGGGRRGALQVRAVARRVPELGAQEGRFTRLAGQHPEGGVERARLLGPAARIGQEGGGPPARQPVGGQRLGAGPGPGVFAPLGPDRLAGAGAGQRIGQRLVGRRGITRGDLGGSGAAQQQRQGRGQQRPPGHRVAPVPVGRGTESQPATRPARPRQARATSISRPAGPLRPGHCRAAAPPPGCPRQAGDAAQHGGESRPAPRRADASPSASPPAGPGCRPRAGGAGARAAAGRPPAPGPPAGPPGRRCARAGRPARRRRPPAPAPRPWRRRRRSPPGGAAGRRCRSPAGSDRAPARARSRARRAGSRPRPPPAGHVLPQRRELAAQVGQGAWRRRSRAPRARRAGGPGRSAGAGPSLRRCRGPR